MTTEHIWTPRPWASCRRAPLRLLSDLAMTTWAAPVPRGIFRRILRARNNGRATPPRRSNTRKAGRIHLETYTDEDGHPAPVNGWSRHELVSEDEEARTYVMRVINESPAEDATVYPPCRPMTTMTGSSNPSISGRRRESPVRGPRAREVITGIYQPGPDHPGAVFRRAANPHPVKGAYGIRLETTIWPPGEGNLAGRRTAIRGQCGRLRRHPV